MPKAISTFSALELPGNHIGPLAPPCDENKRESMEAAHDSLERRPTFLQVQIFTEFTSEKFKKSTRGPFTAPLYLNPLTCGILLDPLFNVLPDSPS